MCFHTAFDLERHIPGIGSNELRWSCPYTKVVEVAGLLVLDEQGLSSLLPISCRPVFQ